ncbi:MAG TPA: tRNA (adenosine(37)-N6)-threonylcarbamoyltransferase complex transferase subunit TsaD [Longimicrobiales bacterium]|nr:tRNA (adenosine(37)-N6)-threonylcarbamoyltransferase complex transferase subunit TsaD [Longimicrobiales bacterium]
MSAGPVVLAVETSCDETSAAVLRAPRELLGHVILSQDIHRIYGGVVPELASRAHLQAIDDVVAGALTEAAMPLADIDVVAATAGPGLIGALLVGLTWAKALAWGLGRPFVPVHHMEAHLFATELEHAAAHPPFVALLVSGGHTLLIWVPEWGTYELLGETRDDAAGEAFDKVARILGLGYPGGPAIQSAAAGADPRRFAFPRPMLARNQRPGDPDYYAFSFSGLKTSVLTRVRELEAAGTLPAERPHLAASFQAAVVDTLVAKTLRAVAQKRCPRVVLGGGVAASRALREGLAAALPAEGELHAPSPRLATDNAAMIARAALFRFERGEVAGLAATARADLPFPGLQRRPPAGAPA